MKNIRNKTKNKTPKAVGWGLYKGNSPPLCFIMKHNGSETKLQHHEKKGFTQSETSSKEKHCTKEERKPFLCLKELVNGIYYETWFSSADSISRSTEKTGSSSWHIWTVAAKQRLSTNRLALMLGKSVSDPWIWMNLWNDSMSLNLGCKDACISKNSWISKDYWISKDSWILKESWISKDSYISKDS